MNARNMRPVPRLLSNVEAAEVLGVTPRALEQLRGRGGGPLVTYVGRFPRYSLRAIDAYLAQKARRTNDR